MLKSKFTTLEYCIINGCVEHPQKLRAQCPLVSRRLCMACWHSTCQKKDRITRELLNKIIEKNKKKGGVKIG
jgi:hypothetical protein